MRFLWPYISQIISDKQVSRVIFRDISNPATQYRKIFRNTYEVYRIPDKLNIFPGLHYVSVNIGEYMTVTWDMEEVYALDETVLDMLDPVFILNKWRSPHKQFEHPAHGDCYTPWIEANSDLCFIDKKNVHRCNRIRAFFEAPRISTSVYKIKRKIMSSAEELVLRA